MYCFLQYLLDVKLIKVNACKSYMSQSLFSFIINIIASYIRSRGIQQKIYRVLVQSAYYSSAMKVRFSLLLCHQYYCVLQRVQMRDILRLSVVNTLFFSNAIPISFAPSSPSLFPSIKNSNKTIKGYTEIQCSQFMVLLQSQSDFFCPFISNFVSFYKSSNTTKQKRYTKAQRSQSIVLLQRKSNFFRPFISNIIFSYKIAIGITKVLPRSSVVSTQLLCNANPISFTPSWPILFPPKNQQISYQGLTQSMRYYCAMLIQFPLPLYLQHYYSLCTVTMMTDKNTKAQRTQHIIFIQCQSNFLYTFISNIIARYQGYKECQTATYRGLEWLKYGSSVMQIQFPLFLYNQCYFPL
eukprot:TRINITY_DN1155_c0_g1_i5.p1 TRINITY_DN1155_c0_g1~~TRINITY_DN1155_c0_g1_i5.p1  ORF type:complete len:375 (+),score=-55.45 TRINITY_DN1155_c0_g1_i5:68-1126(+)